MGHDKRERPHQLGAGSGGWIAGGFKDYFQKDRKVDAYRTCEVLYGNGGYLFFYPRMRKVHALTECLTVGVAQRYYALQPVDSVKYGRSGQWRTLEEIVARAETLDDIHAWFKRFHVRYENGCHVWANRDEKSLEVTTTDNRVFKLPQKRMVDLYGGRQADGVYRLVCGSFVRC